MRTLDPVRWCTSLDESAEGRTAAWITTNPATTAVFGPDLEPTAADLRDIGGRRGHDARLFLSRRSTLRRLVGRWCGVPAATVVIGYGEAGRPAVLTPEAGPSCSVAARGTFAAFALSPHPVGVDLEPVTEGEIPWAVLADAEASALRRLPVTDQHFAFLEIWTVKEAYLKALGSGLLRDPATLSVSLAQGLLVDQAQRWSLPDSVVRRVHVGGSPVIAACVGLRFG